MKKMTTLVTVTALLGLLAVSQLHVQGGPNLRGGGWGSDSQYNRLYDTNTVETVFGEVLAIEQINPLKGMSYGVHLQLKTEKGTISVHLGPAWFIENQDMVIELKDKVEIKGSRVKDGDNKPAIIAAEVKKHGHVLKLRDEYGIPVWAGWRRQ